MRGRVVCLNSLAKTILHRHNYPPLVNHYLTELMALAAALSNVMKFEGVFTLQVQGEEAPINFMVVDVTSEGHMRACANFDEERIESIASKEPSLHQLFGNGTLAFTVDQGEHTDRYQGIVDLRGISLRECLQHYFHQSEQLETAFFIGTTEDCKAFCIMIQKLPFDQQEEEKEYDDWFTALSLLSTLKAEEVFAPKVTSQDILHKLFWQEGLVCFEPTPLSFKCRCDRKKIEGVLSQMSEEERQQIAVDRKITVTCDFCSEDYVFDAKEAR